MYNIDDDIAFKEYKQYLYENSPKAIIEGDIIKTNDFQVRVLPKYSELFTIINDINQKEVSDDYGSDLIFGKDKTEKITAIELKNDELWLFFNDGKIEKREAKYWICSSKKLDRLFKKLEGNGHYKYIRIFKSKDEYKKWRAIYNKKDIFCVWNDVEAQMITKGITLFKGLKVEDVSILSFDIEGKGLSLDESSEVFVITNTLKVNNKKTIKQFREDEYDNQGEMIEAWCQWVREVNPTILNGHNIFSYDLPYLDHVASKYNKKLLLGRDGSEVNFSLKPKKYRVDGSQTWEYHNCEIFGRHVIDGMFLAVKYDIGRNYPGWGLKTIAEYEGLVSEERQFYDASQIGKNWPDLVEREKIVKYCEDDGNDSMNLYELMIPSFFYMSQNIPKSFQTLVNSASGSWLNSIMLRSYLQNFSSIPKASEASYVGGGMSYGIPGVYDNVTKWDAKSYYPSTILKYEIYDPIKDPQKNYIKMVEYFTLKRFEQKQKYKETGDKYYDDLQAASKVFINSAYGLLGTRGLNFNCFQKAALITRLCRKGLQKCIIWATGKDYKYWWKPDDTLYKKIELSSIDELKDAKNKYENRCEDLGLNKETGLYELYVPKRKTNDKWKVSYCHSDTGRDDFEDFSEIDKKSELSSLDMPKHDWILVNIDTDSLSFAKKDGSPYTSEEKEMIFTEINKIMYSEWEDDGMFDRVVVSKAKNYVLKNGDKITFKGSSLSDKKKEPALLEMLDRLIKECFIYETKTPSEIYHEYIKEVSNIKDIKRWLTKKSITENLLKSERANETKVVDAIKHLDYQIGDKVYLYNAIDGETQAVVKGEPFFYKKTGLPKMIPNRILKHVDLYNSDYDKDHYLDRVYMTISILENIVDMKKITKYSSKNLLTE